MSYAYASNDNASSSQLEGTISPQLLAVDHAAPQQRSHYRRRPSNPAYLSPGNVHPVPCRPSSRSVLYTSQISPSDPTPPQARSELQLMLRYIPRMPEHTGTTTLPPIVFSVGGEVGPRMYDIVMKKVEVDGADDPVQVFQDHGWHLTQWVLDFPGLPRRPERIYTTSTSNAPLTMSQLAREISARIGMALKKAKASMEEGVQVQVLGDEDDQRWRLENVRYKDLRIVGMNYYYKEWVPVLAVDA